LIEHPWSIRPYRDGDEEGIFKLLEVAFPSIRYDKQQWLRFRHWIDKDNPAGTGMIWLAEHDGKIIGHSSIIPVVMKVGTEVVTGFQSIGTMTHPSYRRQGIYETLAKKVYSEAERTGIHIGYRFPNENSYPIAIKKLDWFDIGHIRPTIRIYDVESTVRRRIKNRFVARLFILGARAWLQLISRQKKTCLINGLTITQIPSFDERINEFWPRVSSQAQIMVVRNKDYLNWRYVAVPDVNYLIYIAEEAGQICGYLVLRCLQQNELKTGIIFDILAQSEEIAQCLISKAVERCEQERVDFINGSMIANKIYLKALRRNSFIAIPFIKGSNFCAYSSSPHISKDFLKYPGNWLVQLGDSDTV